MIGFTLAGVIALGRPLWGGSCPLGSAAASSVTIHYPSDGSLFPSDITSPTFVWRDAATGARVWKIEIVFGGRGGALRAESAGAQAQLSCGTVNLSTSTDPVGSPVFFRDVPLVPPPVERTERSAIKPFSRDGATIGLDVDGPQNDKGLYGLAPLKKVTSITNDNVILWSAYSQTGSPKRFGCMSQVSPDGRFVVTSVEAKGW